MVTSHITPVSNQLNHEYSMVVYKISRAPVFLLQQCEDMLKHPVSVVQIKDSPVACCRNNVPYLTVLL